jgi:hypothetical protein
VTKTNEQSADGKSRTNIPLRYEQTLAAYTSQFVLVTGSDEVFIDCSSGVILQDEGQPSLPIHTRLALPWTSARQLAELLDQVVRQHDSRNTTTGSGQSSGSDHHGRVAKLPKMESLHV